MTIFRHLGGAWLALFAVPAHAQGYQSLDAIDAAIAAQGISARPLDQRLRLAACPVAPVVIPAGDAIVVTCEPLNWRLRIPVVATGGSQRDAPLVIRRGDPVAIMVDTAAFSVNAQGIADSDARRGASVRVKLDTSGPAIVGQAIDIGVVRIAALKDTLSEPLIPVTTGDPQ